MLLDRVQYAAIFEVVGVYFAGPIYLKGGQKAWICIFTCAVYRAAHLELVNSLNVASFLMALGRPIAIDRQAERYSRSFERLIGVLKRLLRCTLKKSCLNYEEMLRSRYKLTTNYFSYTDSHEEAILLTPVMFLQEVNEIGVIDLDKVENVELSKRFSYRQKIKRDLCQHFRN